jgi:radical SAM/Cys-rich protein
MLSDQKKNDLFSQAIDTIGITPFQQTLDRHGITLLKDKTTTLQINIGLRCNQTCRHCHLDASPGRGEMMIRETMNQVIEFARCGHFETIDITGGAPELHPDLGNFIKSVSHCSPKTILRSNLTALSRELNRLMDILKESQTTIVASFPSLNEVQLESFRGKGSFQSSIDTLKTLNEMGYGKEKTGLELDLVVNPSGSFLPPSQAETENRFHRIIKQKWGIRFNRLYTFANVPLGRFRTWLVKSGNFENYMEKLISAFNPCAIKGLMCRNLVSVSWDGYLFDCDFNQAAGLFLGKQKTHVSEIKNPPEPGTPIAVGNHCFTCTAGSGFT